MAGKKTSGKKAAAGKKNAARKKTSAKQKTSFMRMFFRRVAAVALFVLVCLGAGAGYYVIQNLDDTPDPFDSRVVKSPQTQKPVFEVFPEETAVKPAPPKPAPPPSPAQRPRVALIIDDLGYDYKLAEKFLSLDVPFTYSILPHSPYRREIANAARLGGFEVMLHLPMEPYEYPEVDPGPGALLSSMSPDERISVLRENLASVPFISGVNNHMGSKMTSNSSHMNQILSIIKKRGLYYIDSLTTHDSKSKSSARLFQVPFAQRDIFIDHDPRPEAIRSRLEHLVRIAEMKGHSIGIAHPYEATYETLAEMLPQLKDRVEWIPASEAVRLGGYYVVSCKL